MKPLSSTRIASAFALALALALPGCAVVTVAGATVGAVLTVSSAVVGTAVKVTGKVVEKTVDLVTPSSTPAPSK